MKKSLLFIALCMILSTSNIVAQKSNMIFSEKTPELKDITGSKVKLLKNGNTIFLQFTKEDGIYLKLYDTNKKKITEGKLPLKLLGDKMKGYKIAGIFEINNDLMLMFGGYNTSRTPTLYRLILDGMTGIVKKEEPILEMTPLPIEAFYAVEYKDIPLPSFAVEKDPVSNCYAVVALNTFASETNKRIQVAHYSPLHVQLNKAYFISPESRFKYSDFTDIFVYGENAVILSTYIYNTKSGKDGKEESIFYFSKLNKNSTTFINTTLTYAIEIPDAECEFMYDASSKNVNAIIKTYDGIDKKSRSFIYSFFVQPFNPNTMALGKSYKYALEKANAYYTSNVNIGKQYTGMIQNLIVDQSGNNILLNEMPITYDITTSNSTYVVGETINTLLENIAITSVTQDGKENYSLIIPYNHFILNGSSSFNYIDNKKGKFTCSLNDKYYGACVDLVAGEKNNYVLLNNTVKNVERPESDKSIDGNIKGGSSWITPILYTISSNGTLTKQFLFDKPAADNVIKYCLFQTADFNPSTGTYAVLVSEKIKGKKMDSIVWFNLE
jgi:hypothetical protein